MNRAARIRLATSTILLAGLLSVSVAHATHDEPRRGKSIKAPLITAYKACLAPDTTAGGTLGIPACKAIRNDAECGFGGPFFSNGFGKADGTATPQGDFKLSFVARNLNPGCEGRKLCAVASLRMTTENCADAPCTVELPDFVSNSVTACCVVQGGACSVSTTFNSEYLGAIVRGTGTGLEITGCGLRRMDGPDVPASGYTFACGLLVP